MSGDHDRALAIKNTTHYCPDWDGLKISCENDEYECCTCTEYNGMSGWVGLTDQDIDYIKQNSPVYVSAKAVSAIVPIVEAKLKEKNT